MPRRGSGSPYVLWFGRRLPLGGERSEHKLRDRRPQLAARGEKRVCRCILSAGERQICPACLLGTEARLQLRQISRYSSVIPHTTYWGYLSKADTHLTRAVWPLVIL